MNKLLLILSVTGAMLAAAGVYNAIQANKPHQVSDETLAAWGAWKSMNGKSYSSQSEEAYRLGVFDSNLNFINQHNAAGNEFTVAMNTFGDMTNQEFVAQYNGYRPQARTTTVGSFKGAVADAQDWTTKGAVTPIKNQGQCGSCWAFSSTGGMEGGYFLKTGNLVSFSEQQLVDCDKASGDQGCNGGLPENAFGYYKQKGSMKESDYSYKGVDASCQYDASKVVSGTKLTGFTSVPKSDSDALKAAVSASPVSIGIDAAGLGWQFYFGGIMAGTFCGHQLDHGVLIVGYGTDSGKDFWKIKNSWGSGWGEKGYLRIKRVSGKGVGACGLTEDATVPNF